MTDLFDRAQQQEQESRDRAIANQLAQFREVIDTAARDLAPQVRVNGVAPGANLWPENGSLFDTSSRQAIEASIPLGRIGTPDDIAVAVGFLLLDAHYITGHVLPVDGGRSIVL